MTSGSAQGRYSCRYFDRDALAIPTLLAQLPNIVGVLWLVRPLPAAGIAIIMPVQRVVHAAAAPLIGTAVLPVITVVARIAIRTTGNEGALPDRVPPFLLALWPWFSAGSRSSDPSSLRVALVGLTDSLVTAKLVEEVTATRSRGTREPIRR